MFEGAFVIKSNPAWQMVEVYSDEGISATSTKKREGFNRMIADELDGKIDLKTNSLKHCYANQKNSKLKVIFIVSSVISRFFVYF